MTIQESERAQLRHEVRRAIASDSVASGERYDNPQIVSLPRDAFQPPSLIYKTAPDMYSELSELLLEAWDLNEQFVGERLIETMVHLSFADLHRPLITRLQKWCETYFLRRLQKDNSRDKGNPIATCERLVQECQRILLGGRDSGATIASKILAECVSYTRWFVHERIGRPFVMDHIRRLSESEWGRGVLRNRRDDLQDLISEELDFGNLLTEVAETIDSAWLTRRAADTADGLHTQLRHLVDDIQQMRPFLVRNFRAEKTILKLSDQLCVAFDWTIGMMIGMILHGETVSELQGLIARRECASPLLYLNRDGLLADYRNPWRTSTDLGDVGITTGLHVNLYLLERFHEKLFSFYDQIDFEAIRRRLEQANEAELDEEELSVSCQDLAVEANYEDVQEVASPTKLRLRIEPLRLQRLLKVLEEDLGCEVARGKGSEITLYRPGGRKYVLGGHAADYAVPVYVVKPLLSRLGIQPSEWIAACQKNGRARRRPR